MTHTPPLASQAGFVPPPNRQTAGTPAWLYDEIMRWIEPDLLLNVIPHHDELYGQETAEQREQRMKWYERAFVQFDRICDGFTDQFYAFAQELKHFALDRHRTEETHVNAANLSPVESALTSPLRP